MSWTTQTLVRGDDPYHAWSYAWRVNALGLTPEGYCPVLVMLREARCGDTDLLASLDWIDKSASGEGLFLMSPSDVRHLNTLRARLKTDAASADLAMYAAKSAGRNQVRAAADESDT